MDESSTKTYARFTLLPTIMKCRQMYGLRNDDYKRYRQFCSNRLARLRKTLGFRQRKGKEFQRRELTSSTLTDLNQLWILVFEIERYWSYSMDLEAQARYFKDLDQTPKRKHKNTKLRALLVKLLRFSQILGEIMTPTAKIALHPTDALDVRAYICFMKGYIRFEMGLWNQAMQKFMEVKSIYEKLMQLDTDHLSRESYLPKAIEALDPYFRCCTYHLAKKSNSMEGLAQWIANTQKQTALETDFDQLAISTNVQTAFELQFLGSTLTVQHRSVVAYLSQLADFVSALPRLASPEERKLAYQAMVSTVFGLEQRAGKLLLQQHQQPLLMAYTHYMKHMVPIHRTHAQLVPLDPIQPITLAQIRVAPDALHYHDTLLQHMELMQHPYLLSSPGLQSSWTNTLLLMQAWKEYTLGMLAAKQRRWVHSQQHFHTALELTQKQVMWIPFHPQAALPFPEIPLTADMCEGRLVWLRAQSHLAPPLPRLSLAHAPSSRHASHFFLPGKLLPVPAKPVLFDLAHSFIHPAPLGFARVRRLPKKDARTSRQSIQRAMRNPCKRSFDAIPSSLESASEGPGTGLLRWFHSFRK